MNLRNNLKFYKFLMTVTVLFFIANTLTAAEISLFFIIPDEVISKIIAEAYTDYKHPIEFTYLATVAKHWHAIITNPAFIPACEAKGFVEPAMVFYGLDKSQREDSDILKKDLTNA